MKTGDKIKEMLLAGYNYPQIMKHLGVAGSTIAYHVKKLSMRKQTNLESLYDWNAVQAYYDKGFSIGEVTSFYNIPPSSFRDARTRGLIKTIKGRKSKYWHEHRILVDGKYSVDKRYTIPDELLLCENSDLSQTGLRKKYLEYSIYECANEKCPLYQSTPIWCNGNLVLHLDHINGIRNDNRLKNLRWLCPNCHSQTPTYCGRNKRKT